MGDWRRDDWEQMDRLFEAALDLPPDQREQFLAGSGAPAFVVKLVRDLLGVDGEAEARIGESAEELALAVLGDGGSADDDAVEFPPGSQIGPYRVVAELGRGGMGTVYLAERAAAPYERRVAVKVVKRGMDTDEILQRFRREGRIMARLEHPGIGRMYDADVTGDGRPYLVLEHIEGQPIDRFCDARRLDVSDRIRLFLQVSEAVSFAHQKMVLHRDLKPSNILVTDDGPKLLDFGIGKMLDEVGSPGGDITTVVGRRLTPEYASPEQLAGDAISTASDVFSLAVVLHELLTGVRPERNTARAPSTVVTEERDDDSGAAAPVWSSTRKGLARRLRGDLDVILMKALHDDVARRYSSVEAFAADLQRHLDGFPVTARPDSVTYRARRFVERNRLPVLSGSGVAVSIVLFGIGSLLQQAQTARERERADQERVRAEEVASVLENLFTGAGVATAERIDTLTVRQFLDRSAERVIDELEGQPAVQGRLLRVFGLAQLAFGRLAEADRLLSRSVDVLETTSPFDEAGVLESKRDLAHLLQTQGRLQEAIELYEAWLSAEADVSPAQRAEVYHNVGSVMMRLSEFDSAASLLDRALAIQRSDSSVDALDHASALSLRGGAAQRMGDLALAAELVTEAAAVAEAEFGPDHPLVFVYQQNRAFLLYLTGESDAALPLFEELAVRFEMELGETPGFVALLDNYSSVLRDLGRPAEALPLNRRAVGLGLRLFGPDHPQLTYSYDALGTTLEALERYDEALAAHREQLRVNRASLGPASPSTAVALVKVAALECLTEALPPDVLASAFEEAEAAVVAAFPAEHRAVADVRLRQGRCYVRIGRVEEGREELQHALEWFERAGGPAPVIQSVTALLAETERG